MEITEIVFLLIFSYTQNQGANTSIVGFAGHATKITNNTWKVKNTMLLFKLPDINN
jgi:hypothetical protein